MHAPAFQDSLPRSGNGTNQKKGSFGEKTHQIQKNLSHGRLQQRHKCAAVTAVTGENWEVRPLLNQDSPDGAPFRHLGSIGGALALLVVSTCKPGCYLVREGTGGRGRHIKSLVAWNTNVGWPHRVTLHKCQPDVGGENIHPSLYVIHAILRHGCFRGEPQTRFVGGFMISANFRFRVFYGFLCFFRFFVCLCFFIRGSPEGIYDQLGFVCFFVYLFS